jgi:hypothetical protein
VPGLRQPYSRVVPAHLRDYSLDVHMWLCGM